MTDKEPQGEGLLLDGSKLYMKEITHCFACPHHFRWTYKEPSKWMCDKSAYREILTTEVDTHGKNFPKWCPLTDAESMVKLPAPGTEAYQKLQIAVCKHLNCYDKDCEYHGFPRCPYCIEILDSVLALLRGEQ